MVHYPYISSSALLNTSKKNGATLRHEGVLLLSSQSKKEWGGGKQHPYCSTSQSRGTSHNEQKGCHQPRRAGNGRRKGTARLTWTCAVVVVATEASRVHGIRRHFAVDLEAGGRLPAAEQYAPEVRPALVGAGHGRADLRVVLAVQHLKVLGVVDQDVQGLRRRRVRGLAGHEPPGDLGECCDLDTTVRGEFLSEIGVCGLLVTHIAALALVCFDVLQSNASQTLVVRKRGGLAGSTVAVDQ